MRDQAKVTHVDGVSYCDVCGQFIDAQDECNSKCPSKAVDRVDDALKRAKAALDTLDDMTPEERAFQLVKWALGAEFKP